MKRLSFYALTILALPGCTIGPDYQKPVTSAPETFTSQEVFAALNAEKVQKEPFATNWWTGFGDTILNQLVDEAIAQNFTIAAATARVKQAQARVKLAGAGDNLTLDSAVNSSLEEQKQLNRENETTTTNRTLGSLAAILPLDIFGKTRREVQSARANLEAAEEDLKSIILMTSSDIAKEYLGLRGDQRQLELLEESVQLQEKTLSIVRSRFESGLAPELDLQRAKASVERLRAQIPPLEERLRNSRNVIAGLTGDFPGRYEELLDSVVTRY
jgi:NodT family efflux transporter outer membrane factor (OMF) lipoprotein